MKLPTVLFLFVAIAHSEGNDGLETSESFSSPLVHTPFESRIVGGTEASPDAYPFFVRWDGCGASLVYEDIILSAAHCSQISSNSVVIGAHSAYTLDPGAESRTITSRRSHPDYDASTLENDFLVMKLNQPSTKTPVPLNSDTENPAAGDILTVMGLGTTTDGGNTGSSYLQEVDVSAVSHEECSDKYDGGIDEDVMLCAGVVGGGQDSCQGDSGGPIIDLDGTQVGVVSWGIGCGLPDYPGVYSRISGVDEWIMEQICALSANPPESCPDGAGDQGDGDSDEAQCDPDDGSGSVCVRFSFFLDGYPQETTAELFSSSTGESIQFSDFEEPGARVDQVVRLEPGDYTFTMFDSYGDGMCCNYGDGRFEAHAILPNEEILLVDLEGSFDSSVQVQLTVPGLEQPDEPDNDGSDNDASDPDDQTGECNDQSGTFYANGVEGDVDCVWLSDNLVRYNFLCQFLDVASLCPSTCEACEYFD